MRAPPPPVVVFNMVGCDGMASTIDTIVKVNGYLRTIPCSWTAAAALLISVATY